MEIEIFTIFFFIGLSLGILTFLFQRITPAIIGGVFFAFMGLDLISNGLSRQVVFYNESGGKVVTYTVKIFPEYSGVIGVLLLFLGILNFYYAYDIVRR